MNDQLKEQLNTQTTSLRQKDLMINEINIRNNLAEKESNKLKSEICKLEEVSIVFLTFRVFEILGGVIFRVFG